MISLQRTRQLADAREALMHTAELASGLKKEIQTRQATLEAIEADIAANRVLASIDQGKAACIVELMNAATAAAHQRLLRANRVDQIVFPRWRDRLYRGSTGLVANWL